MTTKQIQLLLAYLGYNVDPDGLPGPQTSAAVRDFQKEYGDLAVDGYPGAATCAALQKAVGDGWVRPTATDSVVEDTSITGTFWADIPNFRRSEFACKCGGKYCDGYPAEPREDLVRLAQAARDHFGAPCTVVSGLRCEKWNSIQGGVDNSQHMYGEACDLYVSGVSGDTVLSWFMAQPGVRYAYKITGSQNVHFDVPKGQR